MQPVTKIVYHIPILCNLHISNKVELIIINNPPIIEESTIHSVNGIVIPLNKNPTCIVRINVHIGGAHLKYVTNNFFEVEIIT